jgi:hypothetical protein
LLALGAYQGLYIAGGIVPRYPRAGTAPSWNASRRASSRTRSRGCSARVTWPGRWRQSTFRGTDVIPTSCRGNWSASMVSR